VYDQDGALLGGLADALLGSDKNTALIKYTFDGNFLWSSQWGSTGNDWYSSDALLSKRYDIAVHEDNIYCVGWWYGGDCYFYDSNNNFQASHTLSSIDAAEDMWIVRLTDDGNYVWTSSILTYGSQMNGMGIAADCHGVYVGGSAHASWSNELYFPSGAFIDYSWDQDMFVAFLDPNTGIEYFSELIERQGNEVHQNTLLTVTSDGLGNVFVGGTIDQKLMGPFLNTVPDSKDGFILHYLSDGTYQNGSGVVFGGGSDDYVFDLDVTRQGVIYGAGMISDAFTATNGYVDNNINAFVGRWSGAFAGIADCCAVTAVAGTVVPDKLLPCTVEDVTFTLSGETGNVQWLVSTDGGDTWSSIPGATGSTLVHSEVVDYSIRAITWLPSCGVEASNVVAVDVQSECVGRIEVQVNSSCEAVVPNLLSASCEAGGYTQSPLPGTVLPLGSYMIELYDPTA
ncbi:MAG: hypothetical protein HKN32_05425, partial [Flavobacteriales bacterium]|nr:hypothetical protein [Flavobacteriales bacterium]